MKFIKTINLRVDNFMDSIKCRLFLNYIVFSNICMKYSILLLCGKTDFFEKHIDTVSE